MSFPSGVLTATLTFSNPLTFLGNEATRTELTVQPSAGVVWAATGQPIDDFAEIITPGPGLPGQLNIPFVDQDGFTDQAGNSFKMWAYVLTRKTFFGNTVKTVKKYWQPLVGQDSTDFDNLPGGTVGLPVAVSPVPVTSVAGEIGAVSAEALVTKLSPYLPDGVTPEAVEANLPPRLADTALSATYVSAFPASTITYNTDGTVATVTENGVTTTYTYNADGTVATDTRTVNGVTTTRTYGYTNGNLTSITKAA
jgi:YD repeat-containing protein